jgi:hypothetical protein
VFNVFDNGGTVYQRDCNPQFFLVVADATDASGVKDVTLVIRDTRSGAEASFAMQQQQAGSQSWVRQVSSQTLTTGRYSYRFIAVDTVGNVATTTDRSWVFDVIATCETEPEPSPSFF